MNLHEDKDTFAAALQYAAKPIVDGGLGIKQVFIEKDYWICRSLKQLSQSPFSESAVFKGGTSLSKAHYVGYRFSEDIDIAVTSDGTRTENQTKNIIHGISSTMSDGLNEVKKPDTRKFSKYRKVYYQYPQTVGSGFVGAISPGQILLEIVAFSNPYPFHKKTIKSFVTEYLEREGRYDLIEKYDMASFEVNVLDKSRTAIEKLVSLFRHSLADDYMTEMKAKIRHFYDLHFLLKDDECRDYILSYESWQEFEQLFKSDQERFQEPSGWQNKSIGDSPLVANFESLWGELAETYRGELPDLSYYDIPKADEIAESFKILLGFIHPNFHL